MNRSINFMLSPPLPSSQPRFGGGPISAEAIARRQPKYQKAGKGFLIPCPAHDDGPDSSCSIWDGENGRIGAKCWARDCSYSGIIRSLGIQPQTNFTNFDYMVASYQHPDGKPHQTFRKDYPGDYPTGPCSHVVEREYRKTCQKTDSHKHIWQTRGTQGYNDGCYLLLWGTDDPVNSLLLVEGEKAALAALGGGANAAGYTPVSWIGGSGRVHYSDFSSCAGRTAVLWADNDEPGLKAMQVAGEKAIAAGSPGVQVIDVSSFPESRDCADFPSSQLVSIIDSATPYVAPTYNQQYNFGGGLNNSFANDYDFPKSFGAEFGIGGGADEFSRIARYYPDHIAATFLESGPRIIIAHLGLFTPLDPLKPQPTGALQILGGEARAEILKAAPQLDTTNRLLRLTAEYFQKKEKTGYWREVMRQSNMIAPEPQRHGEQSVDSSEVDRRDKALLFPLRNGQTPGSAWDYTAQQEMDATAVRSTFLLDHSWEGASPNFSYFMQGGTLPNSLTDVVVGSGLTLEGKPAVDITLNRASKFTNEGAAVMDWFIHQHIGAPFLSGWPICLSAHASKSTA